MAEKEERRAGLAGRMSNGAAALIATGVERVEFRFPGQDLAGLCYVEPSAVHPDLAEMAISMPNRTVMRALTGQGFAPLYR